MKKNFSQSKKYSDFKPKKYDFKKVPQALKENKFGAKVETKTKKKKSREEKTSKKINPKRAFFTLTGYTNSNSNISQHYVRPASCLNCFLPPADTLRIGVVRV